MKPNKIFKEVISHVSKWQLYICLNVYIRCQANNDPLRSKRVAVKFIRNKIVFEVFTY